MSKNLETFWKPQVLRHLSKNGSFEYAIHEVHYQDYGKKWGPTEDALSFRYETVEELKNTLEDFIKSGKKSLICGDNNYEYFPEDIKLWLNHINEPIRDYPKE